MTTMARSRRPAGSPASTGGQFAETGRAETDLDLELDPAPSAASRREVRAGRFAPSVLDPSKVERVDTIDLTPYDDGFGVMEVPAVDWTLVADDWAAEAKDRGLGVCTMCGQHLSYVHVMHHADHGSFCVGTDCAESVGLAGDLGTTVSQLRADRVAGIENRKRKARWDRFLAGDPELADVVARYADPACDAYDEFIADIVASARGRTGEPTERQRDAVVRAGRRNDEYAARRAAEAAMPKIPVPEGRQQVAGEVLSVRVEPNRFSRCGAATTKMLVLDDRGFKVWTTAPGSLCGSDAGLRGRRVAFTADLARSDDDEHFGFGKRPAKASFLPAAATPGSDGAEMHTEESLPR